MTTNTKTVAFVNLKGGVGKTTSAIGTAEALARLGHTVTVRDADPSGAATLWAHKALSAGRPLPFGVEVVNRFTVAAPAEEGLLICRMVSSMRSRSMGPVVVTQTRYGTRSLRHAEEFLAENGLAHCRETIPYKEAMRLAPDEGRFPSASGYGLIAKELSDAFNA